VPLYLVPPDFGKEANNISHVGKTFKLVSDPIYFLVGHGNW